MNKITYWQNRKRLYFFTETMLKNERVGLPIITQEPVFSGQRVVIVVFAVIIATTLHGCLLFWYITRPAPLPLSKAVPLQMISMELTAPAQALTPVVNQAVTPPKSEKLKEVIKPKPDKQKIKAKPKPKTKVQPSENIIKQLDIQKYEQESAVSTAMPFQAQAQQNETLNVQGNDVFIPADSNAAYLNNPKPVYPSEARHRGWQGTVVLRVHVDVEGQAKQVIVQRSSGHEILDESALDAVKEWKFMPAKRGEIAEASWVSVPIVFELE